MLPEVKKRYVETGKVELIFLDFPLESLHPDAMAAAVAAGCAHEQGKFWPFHDLLFESSATFGRDDFPEFAKELGLDATAFSECREKDSPKAGIQQDQREGGFLRLLGTPTFVLGRRIPGKDKVEVLETFGALSYDEIAQKIDHWLEGS